MDVRVYFSITAIVALANVGGAVAIAKEPKTAIGNERPALFQKLIECRAVAEPGARLACFDQQAAALDMAEQKHDVVVVDRAQVREARKTLFGLTLPTLHIFGGAKDDGPDSASEDIKEIDSTIASATVVGYNRLFILADGARWEQTDDKFIADPRPGQPIHIRRAAMGSYLASINKQVAVRVRRIN